VDGFVQQLGGFGFTARVACGDGLDGDDAFFESGDVSAFVATLFQFDEQIGCVEQPGLFCNGHVLIDI
jgi:hypothetical protein